MATPVSTELTDLVYDVLNNTLDAVINARMDQERRYLEIVEDTFLSAEEYIEKHGLRQEVEVNVAGSPVQLQADDLDAMLIELYQERQAVLRRFIDDGPPRLKVELGKINLKLAFSVDQETVTNPESPTTNIGSASQQGERPDVTAISRASISRAVNPGEIGRAAPLERASVPSIQMKLDRRALAYLFRNPNAQVRGLSLDLNNWVKGSL